MKDRRVLVKIAVAAAGFGALAGMAVPGATSVDVGGRLQVLWDDHVVDAGRTTAVRIQHHPQYAGCILTCDRPWEGDCCCYISIVHDNDGRGDLLRMYYQALANPRSSSDVKTRFSADGMRVCYAESRDRGLTWCRPALGLVDFRGSTENNCIADRSSFGWELDNIFVFKDTRPGCPPDELFKAVCLSGDEPVQEGLPPVPKSAGAHSWKSSVVNGVKCERNLWCLVSSDGIHFRRGWLMTRLGAFDSLNTAFWDDVRGEYHLYLRAFHDIKPGISDGIRDVRHSVSKDFRSWSIPKRIDFGAGAEDYQLYTNMIQPYFREPSIFVGFPSRYMEYGGWLPNFDRLPSPDRRKWRMDKSHGGDPRYGLAITDCVFIFSRDGVRFFRDDDAFMRPGPEYADNWVYGDCYPACPLVRTPSPFGGDDEMSLYVHDRHWSGLPSRINRYRLRQDGFYSLHAPYSGAKIVTKPLVFAGKEMLVNFSTSARGKVGITLRDTSGLSIKSTTLFGDKVDRVVDFANGGRVAAFAGKPVVLEFEMSDADVYSFRFR